MEVTTTDLFEQLTKINLRLDGIERALNSSGARGGGGHAAAPGGGGGEKRTGVFQSCEYINRQKRGGGVFRVLEITFANGWKRTVPESKAHICAYFEALSPGDTAVYTETKNAAGFNDIVAVG